MVTPRPKETNPRRKSTTPRPETSARFIPFVPGTEDSDIFQTTALTTAIEVKWAGKKMRGAQKVSVKSPCIMRTISAKGSPDANVRFALNSPSEVKDILSGRIARVRVVEGVRTSPEARRPHHLHGRT